MNDRLFHSYASWYFSYASSGSRYLLPLYVSTESLLLEKMLTVLMYVLDLGKKILVYSGIIVDQSLHGSDKDIFIIMYIDVFVIVLQKIGNH